MEVDQALGGNFAVLTVSDTCYADPFKDRSGPILQQLIKRTFSDGNVRKLIVPDELDQIQGSLIVLADMPDMRMIITTGGTGFAPRDVTPEATRSVVTKECPQLTMAMAITSMERSKFAALTRGICGIRNKTLIINFPGSEKAVFENFGAIRDLLPHAICLIKNDLKLVNLEHANLLDAPRTSGTQSEHSCSHGTASGSNPNDNRNSPHQMILVEKALDSIFKHVMQPLNLKTTLKTLVSPINIPPFRASIKDGYALKSSGFPGAKRVLGIIHAGSKVIETPLKDDECFKINTGAPLPRSADCVIQVENTKLISRTRTGDEEIVEILAQPVANKDVRPVGHDLAKCAKLFPSLDYSNVVINSILASVGNDEPLIVKPKIAIISTGNELLSPSESFCSYKVYDSNTTMLKELLSYFGFSCVNSIVLEDDFQSVLQSIRKLFDQVDFIICSGGVSMGDKDYIKHVLQKLNFKLHIGRVYMKPGLPFTFATNKNKKYFFGLPGNPVSAFVTFHIFALPALRWFEGWKREKCSLTVISVKLGNARLNLDMRPEYARATVTSKQGQLYASINGDQISSRLQSICGADVLVHLPPYSSDKPYVVEGDVLMASVLRMDFISKYE